MPTAMKYTALDTRRLFLIYIITLLYVHCPEGFVLSKATYFRAASSGANNAAITTSLIKISTHLKSSLSTDFDNQNSNRNQIKRQLKLPSVYINTIGMFALGWLMKASTRRWLFIKAGKKFTNAGWIWCSYV